MTASTRLGTWRDVWDSGSLGRFVLLCLGVWLHAADTLVTATLVPAIVGDIGGIAYVAWTISVYQVGAVIAGTVTAAQCRRLGVKRVMALAAACYGIGCVGAALAPAMPVLLVARLIQGMGGGALISLSYVAIQQSFPDHLWSRLFGITSVIWGSGSLLGPVIGGVFALHDAWRAAFWFFAIQAGVLCGVSALLNGDRPATISTKQPLWLPVLILIPATALIAEASVVGGRVSPTLLCVTGLALLLLAGWTDRRSEERLLPVQALNIRHPVGAGLLAVLMLTVATTGFWAYGPLLLKVLFGTQPLASGYILAAEALAWSAGTIMVSGLSVAGTTLIRGGVFLIVAGATGFTFVVPAGSFIGMVVCGVLQGIGFGVSWPSIIARIVRFSGEDERVLAAAAPGILQRIGYTVGAAATGIAANASGLAEGVTPAAAREAGFWVFAAFIPLLAIGMVSAWRFTAEIRDSS